MDHCVELAKRIFCRVPRSCLYRFYGSDGSSKGFSNSNSSKTQRASYSNPCGYQPNLLIDLLSPPSNPPLRQHSAFASFSPQNDLVCFHFDNYFVIYFFFLYIHHRFNLNLGKFSFLMAMPDFASEVLPVFSAG